MIRQLTFAPENLEETLLLALCRFTKESESLSENDCLIRAEKHLEEAMRLSASKPTINVPLAEVLFNTYSKLVWKYKEFPVHVKPWIKGAILYFAQTEDGDHDFDSFMGFEDDCKVLNAVLEFAQEDDLIVNAEEYD